MVITYKCIYHVFNPYLCLVCYTMYISHIEDFILSLFRTGTVYSYSSHQLSLWAIFYMAVLFWAVLCPFHYQSFRNAGRLKYVYTAMTIAGVLLPCVPAGVNLVFGHKVISFSPMVCLVAVQDVGFYTDALLGAFEVAILGTLQALVFWTLVKVCIYQYSQYCTQSSLSNTRITVTATVVCMADSGEAVTCHAGF